MLRTITPLILGLIGEKLAGKDTVAEYLVARHKAVHIRHSHVLDEILALLDLPISRRNEIDLGMGLRRVFGDGILGKALAKRVRHTKTSLVVINGIRFTDELENARGLGAKIIYISAPEEARYARFLKRAEKADDASQTLEQFRSQEKEPTEVQIPAIGQKADYKIENTGTLEELYTKVEALLHTL